VNNTASTRIWILRRGNGKVQVHPSPVNLRSGEEFTIRNLTETEVEVAFGTSSIHSDGAPIPARETSGIFTVVASAPRYFEYDVTLPALNQYAEGGSKPGVIIDP